MLNFSHKNTKCSGRTMIEMIGVLAIIGVLSIGGLFGYKIAMNYHRANETIHDVMLRATNVPMKWEDYAAINDANHQFKFTDLKPYEEVNPMGYTVKVWAEPADSDYEFRVLVENVPQKVCERILNMNPTAVDLIKTGESAKAKPDSTFATPADCVSELGRMGFYFDEDFKGISPDPNPNPNPNPNPDPDPDECIANSDCAEGKCCNYGKCGACPVDPCADNPTSCEGILCAVEGQDADGCLTCTPYDPQCKPENCEQRKPTDDPDYCTKCDPIPCEIKECPEGKIPAEYDEYCTSCIKSCKDDPCLGKTGEDYDCCSRGGELRTYKTGECCNTDTTYCTADYFESQMPDETCIPAEGCCSQDTDCDLYACCGEDGKCTTENCPCRTCEELNCEAQGTFCIYEEDGCAKGCAPDCPEGTHLMCTEYFGLGTKCYCIGTVCGTNKNGQKGAQSTSLCCGITYMKDTCGAEDDPFNHVWVGDVFALGDGTTNYCCCSENDSEECCQASKGDTYHLMDEDGDGTKECVEYLGCIYEYTNPEGKTGPDCWYDYPENLVGTVGPDCWYAYPTNLEGKVLPDCKVTGYTNPEEHCYWTDENGNQQDSGYPCRTYKHTYRCNCDDDGCDTCEEEVDAGKSCKHSYSVYNSNDEWTDSYSCIAYWHEETLPGLNVSSCPSGEYCRVVYSENDCNSSLGSTGASTMYGVCTAMDSNSASCPQGVHLTDSDLTEVQGCSTGEYCRLVYSANNCSSGVGSTGAPMIYGICTAMDSNSSSCPQAVHLTDADLIEVQGCDDGKYCRLSYSADNCSDGLSSTGASRMYGVCSAMDNNSASCPQVVHLNDEYLTATLACPAGYYCNLSWSAQDCSSGLSSTGSNPMYGACLAMTSNSATCPN